MQKTKDNRKVAFSVLGEVVLSENKKRIQIKSPDHYQQQVAKLVAGSRVALTVEEYVATRSQQQLAYHFVLMGYIATDTGHSKEECHDAVMRAKFGTKRVKIGSVIQEVRKSIAERARLLKSDCVELIEYDLQLCAELGISVPDKQELGYI